eukprot:4123584-Pleurochrysis_carterae.AAC.1
MVQALRVRAQGLRTHVWSVEEAGADFDARKQAHLQERDAAQAGERDARHVLNAIATVEEEAAHHTLREARLIDHFAIAHQAGEKRSLMERSINGACIDDNGLKDAFMMQFTNKTFIELDRRESRNFVPWLAVCVG